MADAGNNVHLPALELGDTTSPAGRTLQYNSPIVTEALDAMRAKGGDNSATTALTNTADREFSHAMRQDEIRRNSDEFLHGATPGQREALDYIRGASPHQRSEQTFKLAKRPEKEGQGSELCTGDTLLKTHDGQVLVTPDGGVLSMKPDGSFSIDGKGSFSLQRRGDSTTISYPNGDSISFNKNGLESVTRSNKTVAVVDGPTYMMNPTLH